MTAVLPRGAVYAGPKITDGDEAAFHARLGAAVADEAAVPARTIDGRRVAWAPQPGSQTSFLGCPVFEALYHGTRGPGKSDALLMSFAQYVGRGYGPAWRGALFRRTYPELADIVAKSRKWFTQIFPRAQFNQSKMIWTWPDGEALLLRHIGQPDDMYHYIGHEYPWIGFEELTTWPTPDCFTPLFACCRSAVKGVPRMIRSTTNPHGIGHGWVADRYQLRGQWWKTILVENAVDHEGHKEHPRVAVHGHLSENKLLLEADPHYAMTISAAATSPAMREAWLSGSWDIVAGGMFDDVWDRATNIVPEFDVPTSWRLDRSFDWGSSAPFSVGWFARSDGSDLTLADGRTVRTVRGDVFMVAEWYGWTGKPNTGLKMLAVDVAKGIVERELAKGWRRGNWSRVHPGPADTAIYTTENGVNIALDMARKVRVEGVWYPGVEWTRADKRPGSRKTGWEHMRQLMSQARAPEGAIRERPGFFVVGSKCPQFLRTVPTMARDLKDPDDIPAKESEDHIADMLRYRLRSTGFEFKSGRTVGHT